MKANEIGNLNVKPEDCIMGCIICGATEKCCLVAHRKPDGILTGYNVFCHEHADESKGLVWTIKDKE